MTNLNAYRDRIRKVHRLSDRPPARAQWKAAVARAVLLVALVSASLVVSTRSGDAAPQWVMREVQGYRVAMAVESIHDPAESDPMHAQEFDHRVTVAVYRSDGRAPVELEAVALDVAVLGYSGTVTPLAPAFGGRAAAFEGDVRMARGTTYRIRVYFRPAGSPATREARYEYRHHH